MDSDPIQTIESDVVRHGFPIHFFSNYDFGSITDKKILLLFLKKRKVKKIRLEYRDIFDSEI
ncbi:hypothetical protein CH380_05775 [Leptospira adleri]|uniref:Uncharacterized protein n=1 Tax=Leptospira adleri TaxID=2023186 RepID=A0A2M9YR93_9LEPT|nr:hypothetical protein CH380_05775 [Leptospira adleri]PJZ63352.1 hypothetical protein CH376_03695 [Leptospira adleri]